MLAALVFIGGLAAIAYQAYQLNEVRLGIRDLRPKEATDLPPDLPNEETSKKSSLSSLRQLHLMGDPEASKSDPVLDAKNAIDTNLKLELVGTIRGSLGDRDSALIQVKGKETKRYYVGDQIEGGAQLESVSEDTVMLKRAGVLETLRYSKTEVGSANLANAANDVASPGVQSKPRVQPRQKKPAPTDEAPEQQNQQEGTVTSEEVAPRPVTLRERLKGKNRPLTPSH